ncbi:MAG: thioesterase domain-containing protein, partial [Cyanobacteria bacterium P01_F01_bin.3]
ADTASGPLTVVPLTKGNAAPPLFLVHDADGDTGLYLHLARRFGEADGLINRSVYAIAPRIAKDAPLAHSRMETLAADYVAQIRQVQPNGPYLISGLCAGGIVAFEMALQLEQLGETVILSAMDAPAPGAKRRMGRVTKNRLSRLGETFADQQTLLVSAQKVWRKGTNVLRYEVFDKWKKALATGRALMLMWSQDRGRSMPLLTKGLSIRDVLIFAYEQYHPKQKLAGQFLLLRGTEGNGTHRDRPYIEEYADPLFGWSAYCEQAVSTCDLPGGHSTMLNDENVAALAKAIEAAVADNELVDKVVAANA